MTMDSDDRLRRPMALRAVITIDVDAADFVEAAELQATLRRVIEPLTRAFPHANLKFIERRRGRETNRAVA